MRPGIEDALRHGCCGHDLPEPHDYISDPKDDGYRGIHQILRIKSPARPESDGLAVELQIRTVIEHSWATAVEAMDFISGSSLKPGGDEGARRFFALAGALLALWEKAPLPSYALGMAREDLAAALGRLEQSSGLLARLEGQALAAGRVEDPCRDFRGCRVLLLDLEARRLSLTPFAGRICKRPGICKWRLSAGSWTTRERRPSSFPQANSRRSGRPAPTSSSTPLPSRGASGGSPGKARGQAMGAQAPGGRDAERAFFTMEPISRM